MSKELERLADRIELLTTDNPHAEMMVGRDEAKAIRAAQAELERLRTENAMLREEAGELIELGRRIGFASHRLRLALGGQCTFRPAPRAMTAPMPAPGMPPDAG